MVTVRPPTAIVSLPPTHQSTPVKTPAVITELTNPSVKSTGESVADLASKEMRYSAFLYSPGTASSLR